MHDNGNAELAFGYKDGSLRKQTCVWSYVRITDRSCGLQKIPVGNWYCLKCRPKEVVRTPRKQRKSFFEEESETEEQECEVTTVSDDSNHDDQTTEDDDGEEEEDDEADDRYLFIQDSRHFRGFWRAVYVRCSAQ